MKTLYISLTMLACCNISISQETKHNIKDSAKIIDVRYIIDDLICYERNTNIINLPFSRIAFIDVRYDTSFIAISYEPLSGTYILNTKCDLKRGLEASFSSYFMDYFKGSFSNNDAELICYVKKFSIIPEGSMAVMFKDPNSNERPNNIDFEAECYYKCNDSLYPAVRIDTSYMQRSGPLKRSYMEVTKKVLYPLTEKLKNIDSLKIRKRNAYTLQQIRDRYQSRFNLPILKTNQYKKGIYKNFKEFINNSPSVTAFRTETEDIFISLYDLNGSKINKGIFGFSDGENCYIYSSGYCTPLIRVGNSFEYFRTLFIIHGYGIRSSKKFLSVLNLESSMAD